MPTPHKHAELIKKWADDTSLRFQYNVCGKWHDADICPRFNEDFDFRIKPETIRYRTALFDNKWKISSATSKEEEIVLESNPYFIKWLTDWIEVEI